MGTQLIFEILPPEEDDLKVAARSNGRIPRPKEAAQIFEELASQLRPKLPTPRPSPRSVTEESPKSPRWEQGARPEELGQLADQDEAGGWDAAAGAADAAGKAGRKGKKGGARGRAKRSGGGGEDDEGEGEGEEERLPKASSFEEELAQAYKELEAIGLVKKGVTRAVVQNMTDRRVEYLKAIANEKDEDEHVSIRCLASREAEVVKEELGDARERFWAGKGVPGTGTIRREMQFEEGLVFEPGRILGTLEPKPRKAGKAHYVGTPLSVPMLPKGLAGAMHEPCFPPSNEDGTTLNPYGVHPFYKMYNPSPSHPQLPALTTDRPPPSAEDGGASPSRIFHLQRKRIGEGGF